jgi:hypothetical protein
MNKIIGINGPPPASGQQKMEKPNNGLFQQNLEAARAGRLPSGTEATSGPAPLGEVRPTVFPAITTVSTGIANRTESLLDLMENYTQKIQDPKKSLKEIEPLIDSIQKEASQLARETDKHLPEDRTLKNIVNEFAVAANVEYVKFYRGDYNP